MNNFQKVHAIKQLDFLIIYHEAMQEKLVYDSFSEIVLFLAQYSFLFEESQNSVNSCTSEVMQIYTEQAFSDWSMKFKDPSGLYTEDADALLEKQHQSFLKDFKSQVFTKDNPLNQLDFDKAMRIPSDSKTTKSCFTASIINAYAANCKNGITGEEICNVFLDKYGYSNDLIEKDGSPNPEKNIDSISKALAKEKGMDKYIHLGSKNQKLNNWGVAGVITGLSKNEEKKDSHFVYEDRVNGKLDSMDSKRPSAKNYKDNSHRVLTWRRLSNE